MCKSAAEGGGRCATETRKALATAQQVYADAVFAENRADQAVAAREDVVGEQMGLDPTALPERVYEQDEELLLAVTARRDAQDLKVSARRTLDAAVVDHALTPAGRAEVQEWMVKAGDEGNARKAARYANLLNQADDIAAYRERLSARYGSHAGRTAVPARAGGGRARHLVALR